MGREKQVRASFLRSLLHDTAANTIVISAAALVPLTAMVGGGVDASRYYMAASRMQAACDAGALAARRAMTDDTFTTSHRQLGFNFFDQNFETGMFGLTNRTRNFTADEGVVTGTASGVLPTSIMGAFGFGSFEIEVSCSAEINISNTDIMFVLDVTGSMASCPNGSNCGSGPGSKIVALREAVMNFYDTVEDATSDSAQVRYGFVPYSQQVNVGFSLPRAYMADRHTYLSRVARFRNDPIIIPEVPGNGINVGDEIVISDGLENLPRAVSNFGRTNTNNYRFRNANASNRAAAENFCWNTLPGTYNVGGVTWQVFAGTQYRLNMWSGGNSNNRAGCVGRVRKTKIATQADVIPYQPEQVIPNIVWQDYLYCPVNTASATPCGVNNPAGSPAGWETVDLATLYNNNQIQLPTGNQGAMVNHVWDGCVEEAATVNTGNYDPIPANAHDLNINLVPASEAQKWKPALRNAVWWQQDPVARTGEQTRPGYTCPTAARKLTEIERSDLQNYVNSLVANGQTYHDIGMVWGARFISPKGIFASENATAPNGDTIGRHIVFMTDGAQVNSNGNYSTHGIEFWDRRITGDGNGATERTRRAARLQAICKAARQENITVWVVAFGTTLTQNLIDCASPGRAFQASDSTTLNDRFQEIAQKIAALRLTS